MEPVRIGVVGVGNISSIYFDTLARLEGVEVVAVADLDESRAREAGQKRGVARATTTDGLLADPEVELVLNLTIPAAHASVAIQALEAGKHVYSEKPLAIDRESGRQVLELARERRLKVGAAPDTFLGAGLQTARKALDAGEIGEPIGAQAHFLAHGPEDWHPNPDFFYQAGGGPMLDMGPYYVTALVHLLGPVRRVTGSARASLKTRPVALANSAYYGRSDRTEYAGRGYEIPVEIPTHYVGVLDFASGAIGELSTSFDVWHARTDWSHPITIFGTEGTMQVPDPNGFGGTVLVSRHDEKEWREVPVTHLHGENSRGLGVQDMARAIRQGGSHRASGDLAFHALDVMLSVRDASDAGRHQEIASGIERPEAMPEGDEG